MGHLKPFSKEAQDVLNHHTLYYNAMTLLELRYLEEIGRIKSQATAIVDSLAQSMEISLSPAPFKEVVKISLRHSWTRDPFDRLLVAEAEWLNATLITADNRIKIHYPNVML